MTAAILTIWRCRFSAGGEDLKRRKKEVSGLGGGVKERGQRRERAEERSLEGGNGNRSILKEEEVKERFKTKMTEKCFFFFFFFCLGSKGGLLQNVDVTQIFYCR